MLEWRLKAYHHFIKLLDTESDPDWAMIDYPKIDFQDMHYYSAPVKKDSPKSLDEVDPELVEAFNKPVPSTPLEYNSFEKTGNKFR